MPDKTIIESHDKTLIFPNSAPGNCVEMANWFVEAKGFDVAYPELSVPFIDI